MQKFIIRKIKKIDYKFNRIWVIIGQIYAKYAVFLDNKLVSNFIEFLFRIRVPWIYLYNCFENGFEIFRTRVYNCFVNIINIMAANNNYIKLISANAKI